MVVRVFAIVLGAAVVLPIRLNHHAGRVRVLPIQSCTPLRRSAGDRDTAGGRLVFTLPELAAHAAQAPPGQGQLKQRTEDGENVPGLLAEQVSPDLQLRALPRAPGQPR